MLSLKNIDKPIQAEVLSGFRILFGILIMFSMIRFAYYDWISELYIQPTFFFKYYGFEWVEPLGDSTYWLFLVCGIAAFMFACGLFYRVAAITLFLSFTYIELMDKTNYLNHYYFVSLVLFLMIFLPANVKYSLDTYIRPSIKRNWIPIWTVSTIKMMLALVYFYAGLAKLNSDWLIHAMPLKLWLPAKNDLSIIGSWLSYEWVAYAFSWLGALYDLSIPFLLLNRRTRILGFASVVIFHLLTWVLFPIGVFPFVMICSTTIFFSGAFWVKAFKPFVKSKEQTDDLQYTYPSWLGRSVKYLVVVFFTVQLLLPWRSLLYPDELFWTEEGYRFSWRVMLIEKNGYASFEVRDPTTNQKAIVDNTHYLTKNQEKMMATQPDFMIQYAHYLATVYKKMGFENPEVYGTVFVGINGRQSKPFIDTTVDLTKVKDGFAHKEWILPSNIKIYGL